MRAEITAPAASDSGARLHHKAGDASPSLAPDQDQIRRALDVLHGPDDIIELRALHQKGRKRTDAGYFDGTHRDGLIEAAAKLNMQGAAVYVTMNALDPQLLARHFNRVQEFAQTTATDANITRRDWLLIDIDPQRPKDTSATAEQLEVALSRGSQVYAYLTARGWPKPVTAESGNGAHLFYRINLPNDDISRDLVKRCLEALAVRFDDESATIDRSVFNAARIVKLHGTVANKGDDVPAAPWRLSKLRYVPDPIQAVSLELLESLAPEIAQPQPKPNGQLHVSTGRFAWTESDVAAFLARGGIEGSGPDNHNGTLRWKLKRCPFNPEHAMTESAVFLRPNGRLGFKCQHNSCAGRHWTELRELIDGPADSRRPMSGPSAPKVAGVATVAGGEPETLRRPLPPAQPYPLEALGSILGSAARRIHDVVRAPAALCGQSVLAAASLAVQAHADIELDGRREPVSLFVVSVGESGERKSAVDQLALKAHREHERAAFELYRDELQCHEIAATAFEAARRQITKGKKAPAAIKRALDELGPPPQPPTDPVLLATSPTLEGLHKLFATGQPSIGLFHDDGGEFVGGHAMNDDNRMKSAAGLSRLWDCGEFDRIRAGDGAAKHFGKRLALHLMIQPVIAERVLSDDVLTGQGFLARALMVWPESTIGHRPYVEIDLSRDPALIVYRDRIHELLRREPRLKAGTVNELEPRTLMLASEARSAWIEIHNAIETDQKDGGDFASIRPWASKAPSQVLRIAVVLTLIEDPDAGVIRAEAIDRAGALMMHYLGEAARIVGTASVPVEIRNAEALRIWCHKERIQLLHSGAALQYGPNSVRTAKVFDSAIELLERKGWAHRIEGGAEIDGAHRRRAWKIVGGAP